MKNRWRKIARGFASLLVTVVLATTVCFGLLFIAPGDIAEQVARARYGTASTNAAEIAELRRREGLDEPVYVQFGIWLSRVLRGDFGRSLVSKKPVAGEILARLPATLTLALATTVFSMLVAFPIAIRAILRPSARTAGLIFGISLGGAAIPSFWLAYLLMLLVAVKLKLLPIAGYGTVSHLILPVVSLGTGGAALLLQLLHKELQTVVNQDYIRTARAIGVGEFRIVVKYALKNAMLPTIAVLSLFFVNFLEGAVIIETVFAIPGIGRLLTDAIFERDLPTIQGCILTLALIVGAINIFAESLLAVADPRIRLRVR